MTTELAAPILTVKTVFFAKNTFIGGIGDAVVVELAKSMSEFT